MKYTHYIHKIRSKNINEIYSEITPLPPPLPPSSPHSSECWLGSSLSDITNNYEISFVVNVYLFKKN